MFEVSIDPAQPSLDSASATVGPVSVLADLLSKTSKSERIALDTETTGIRFSECALVGVSLSCNGRHFYSPVGHVTPGFANDGTAEVLAILARELTRREITLHNAAFDIVVLRRHGLDLEDLDVRLFDTFLAAHLADPTRRRVGESNKLKELSKLLLGIDQPTYEETAGDLGFQFVDPHNGAVYACFDTFCTLRLSKRLEEDLKTTRSIDYFWKIEMPNVWNTAEMMFNGVPIDGDSLERMREVASEALTVIEQRIHRGLGHVFDVSSSRQLGYALFGNRRGVRRFEPVGQTSSGTYDTSGEALRELYRDQPASRAVVLDILHFRKLQKALSSYLDKFARFRNPKTGRAHANFSPSSISGRYQSSSPNLLSIPKKHSFDLPDNQDRPRTIILSPRSLLKAPEGWNIVVADFSQIDMRGIAHYSQDEKLIKAFEVGKDLHLETLCQLFPGEVRELVDHQCEPSDILARDEDSGQVICVDGRRFTLAPAKFDKLQSRRKEMKAVNFGLSYGMGPPALLGKLNTPENLDDLEDFVKTDPWSMDQAEQVYCDFFKKFKKAQNYKDDVKQHMFGSGQANGIPGGAYRNVFGRLVCCSPYNRLWRQAVTVDVRTTDANYRVRGCVLKMSEAGITVRVHQVAEIELPPHPVMTHEMTPREKQEYKTYHDNAIERRVIFQCCVATVTEAEAKLLSSPQPLCTADLFEFERSLRRACEAVATPLPKFLLVESFHPDMAQLYDEVGCEPSDSLPYCLIDHKIVDAYRFREDGHFIRNARWSGAFRELASYAISSTSTDIARTAMIHMRREIKERWPREPRPKLLLCVHDELVYEVPGDQPTAEKFKDRLLQIMEDKPHPDFRAKIKASAAVGKTYEDAKP